MPVPLAAVLCWLLAIAAVSLPAYAYLGWRRRQRSGA
jgi:hypothetical protein